MKKAFLFLAIITSLLACKDNKDKKDTLIREKDDYGKTKDGTEKETKGSTTTDFNNDETNPEKFNADQSSEDNETEPTPWPAVEKAAFMKSCEKEAMGGGQDKYVAESYCQCMLDKMETAFPDFKRASRLTMDEIQKFGEKNREECLEEH